MNPIVVVILGLLTKVENIWSDSVPHRVVDLTHVFDDTTLNFPGFRPFRLKVMSFDLGGAIGQVEEYSTSTHVGTHMDSPCHFPPGVETVPEIPFYKLIAPAAVVDIRDKVYFDKEYELRTEDLQEWEHTTGHRLNDVVLLIRSGWSKYWSNRTAFIGNSNNDANDLHYPGIKPSALRWLISNRNVYGIGVETLGPNPETNSNSEDHLLLNGNGLYILENVDDMSELPLYGATLYVMPMKIGEACGAPVRLIATIPHTSYESSYSQPSYRMRTTFPDASFGQKYLKSSHRRPNGFFK